MDTRCLSGVGSHLEFSERVDLILDVVLDFDIDCLEGGLEVVKLA